ncbi:MAG: CCE_0567 family metalloprotein [Cyanobacteria bacterium J06597_16]
MVTNNTPTGIPTSVDDVKQEIRRLNSKAGQMKMDLHDIAEGLPANLEQLPQAAAKTYDIYCQLDVLKQKLNLLEAVQWQTH